MRIKKDCGVLFSFPNMKKEEVLKQCQTLSTALTSDGQADIDGTEIVQFSTSAIKSDDQHASVDFPA